MTRRRRIVQEATELLEGCTKIPVSLEKIVSKFLQGNKLSYNGYIRAKEIIKCKDLFLINTFNLTKEEGDVGGLQEEIKEKEEVVEVPKKTTRTRKKKVEE